MVKHSRFEKGIHPETGEVGIWVPFGEGHRITSREQREAYQLKLIRQQGRKHEFTLTDMEKLPEVIALLDTKECGYLLYLQCFVNYDKSRVASSTNGKMEPMQSASAFTFVEKLKIAKELRASFQK